MEYQVSWGEGPLGLTLRPDLGEDMPPVVGRITRIDSAAALSGVAIGHLLVSINGKDTARLGYASCVALLKSTPRPANLRFRIPKSLVATVPSQGQDFTGQSSHRSDPNIKPDLHRTSSNPSNSIDKDHSSNQRGNPTLHSSPPSSRISSSRRETYTIVWTEGPLGLIFRPDDDDCHIPAIRKVTGKGFGASGIERARVGDILVEINSQETKAIGFRKSIDTLKNITKPAALKFKRMRRRISKKIQGDVDSEAVSVLASSSSSLPPPLLTSFPSSSSSPSSSTQMSNRGIYDIFWRDGELGLKLKPTPSDVPMISRLTGRGTASGLHNAHIGDVLVSVNGKSAADSSYTATLRLLKHTPKPVILRFQPSVSSIENAASAIDLTKSGRSFETIPLEVAKQLVATSLNLDISKDSFAAVPLSEIEDNSKEAYLLRLAAKAYVAAQGEKKRGEHKAALTRAEREAQVLAEALEKVKEEAKKYEDILAKQKIDRILRPAIQNKSQAVLGQHKSVLKQLSSVISTFKRDDENSDGQHEQSVQAYEQSLDEMRQSILVQLAPITNTPHLNALKQCAECGVTESLAVPFFLDDDGKWYCTSCWEAFYGDPIVPITEADIAASTATSLSTTTTSRASSTGVLSAPAAPLLMKVAPPQSELPMKGVVHRPTTQEALLEQEMEEVQAQREAQKMLIELEALRRSTSSNGSNRPGCYNHRGSHEGGIPTQRLEMDRVEKEKRGKEELARMLEEEEEKARANGNEDLARKLLAQRIRSGYDLHGTSQHHNVRPPLLPAEMAGATLDDGAQVEAVESEFGHFYKLTTTATMSSAHSTVPVTEIDIPFENRLSRQSSNSQSSNSPSVNSGPPELIRSASHAAASLSSIDDAEEEVVDAEQEALEKAAELARILEQREEANFAMAKQLQDAHQVVTQAHRMSMMFLGGNSSDIPTTEFAGLSEEQINLFKKLTLEADTRASMQENAWSSQDDSDDSEDSDAEEKQRHIGSAILEGEENEEDDGEDNGGYWI